MAIFKVWKDGVYEEVIQESSQFVWIPDGKTKSHAVQRLVYYYKGFLPPALVHVGGKTCIVPSWKEVHPATKLEDIIWEKEEVKSTQPEVITKQFTSKSSPDITYTAKKTTLPTGKIQYSCNCPGVWRSKTRECKHIKELKS